jgi:hypothetical protein
MGHPLARAGQMRFEFLPLRFEFTARESLFFPPGKAANTLRGALGLTMKRIACDTACQDARTCPIRQSCPYAKVFEPRANGRGPSGLSDSPRPFVFRARHLDGTAVDPGRPFHFDLNVFSKDPAMLACFERAFTELAQEGLGPTRGKADLQSIRLLSPTEPAFVDLAPRAATPSKIRVDFLSPTELKHKGHVVDRPDFPILLGRIRDRIATLASLYGEALAIDFQGLGTRAANVRMARCEVRRIDVNRCSSRTGQRHSLGGFVGFAEYEGDLAEFLPWLEAARWTGVGRHAVWGKGEISVARA